MRNERLLFISSNNLLHGMNHRSRHVATYLERRFKYIDIVGFENFYSGPQSAPLAYKVKKGLSDLLFHRHEISTRDSVRQIVIQDIFSRPPLHLLVRDLWRYFVLRQVMAPAYDLAIWGDPKNAWLAWFLKRSGRVERLIYDDWDYFPGWEHSGFSRQLLKSRERLCVRLADAIFTINPLLAQRRMQQGAKQVLVIPNGIDLPLFAQARQKVPHPPTLIYMGTLSPMWGIDIAIKSMPALLQAIPNIQLLIAGTGPAKANLKALSQELGVAENVNFLGGLEYRALPTVLAKADIGIATSLPSSEFRKYASPLKLIEYMAAGLPVIATRVGQTEITMQEAKAGILIDHAVENFVAAAVSLLSDKTLYERCSQAAITYATNFDWDLLLEPAYQYILQMMPNSQVPDAHSAPK